MVSTLLLVIYITNGWLGIKTQFPTTLSRFIIVMILLHIWKSGSLHCSLISSRLFLSFSVQRIFELCQISQMLLAGKATIIVKNSAFLIFKVAGNTIELYRFVSIMYLHACFCCWILIQTFYDFLFLFGKTNCRESRSANTFHKKVAFF